MRNTFSETLVDLARSDPRVLLLTGDHGYALFDLFRKECPDQYINAGIAEQNMVGMAAGLSRVGYRPIVYGLSAFIPIRVVEQIKLDIAHDELPVILVGDGAGLVYSSLGTSHQSTEDVSCTRAIPHLEIYSPADSHELAWAMRQAYQRKRPSYLRIGKADLGDVHNTPIELNMGDILTISREANDNIAVLATGSMVRAALNLAQQIRETIRFSVYSVPTIKPINVEQVIEICRNYSALVVIEEHSVYGGLGSLVSEISSENHPARILKIGIQDRFSHACGSYDYLLEEHGLSLLAIKKRILEWLT